MKKRIVSLLLALVMVLSLVPTTVWAAENHDGQVRVVVENTTYAKADGAAWDGTLVDKWVDLAPGSSMMDCVVAALGKIEQVLVVRSDQDIVACGAGEIRHDQIHE